MHVEFLGVPRQRAGISELEVQAGTLGQMLGTLAARIPSLGDLIAVDRLHSSFVANLNGNRFVSDPDTPLDENDRSNPLRRRGRVTSTMPFGYHGRYLR
jgi:molybdopterin converting factor small subunit